MYEKLKGSMCLTPSWVNCQKFDFLAPLTCSTAEFSSTPTLANKCKCQYAAVGEVKSMLPVRDCALYGSDALPLVSFHMMKFKTNIVLVY